MKEIQIPRRDYWVIIQFSLRDSSGGMHIQSVESCQTYKVIETKVVEGAHLHLRYPFLVRRWPLDALSMKAKHALLQVFSDIQAEGFLGYWHTYLCKTKAKFFIFLMTPMHQLQSPGAQCNIPQDAGISHQFNLFVIIGFFQNGQLFISFVLSQGVGDFQQHLPGNFGQPQRPPHHMEPFRNQPPQGPQEREPLFMGGGSCTQSVPAVQSSLSIFNPIRHHLWRYTYRVCCQRAAASL